MTFIKGRFMVKGDVSQQNTEQSSLRVHRILKSDVSLSFWGGIDPITGVVIDTSHPLLGESVTNTILCLPSGRGSCTASQVLLELILNKIAPKAIVLRDQDGMVCIGAIIAQEIFQVPTLDIVHIGEEGYRQLLNSSETEARILPSGTISLGLSSSTINDEASLESLTVMSQPQNIYLTDEEKSMIRDCSTEAERMALNVIFRYAKLSSDTPKYLPISSAHIDGCTYIGPGGLHFVQRLVQEGGRVKVPTTLNSVSTDRQRWKHYGVPEEYATNSIALGDAYLELGCQPSFTCAPYLLPNPPQVGQDVAWGESNAVVFANSVLGARTEKYADYLECCCSIAGIVPATGVHLEKNRLPNIVVDGTELFAEIQENISVNSTYDIDLLFPTLGYLCGLLSDGRVPLLIGLENWNNIVTLDNLKSFCAAFGTSGSSPLIHIAGITPEAKDPSVVENLKVNCNHFKKLTMQQLEETFVSLDSRQDDNHTVDLVALGNPHLSITECQQLAHLIRETSSGPTSRAKKRIMACMSRAVHAQVDPDDIKVLTDFGVEFVFDTCWCMLLDKPIIPVNQNATILTNSGKYAHYGPALTQRQFRFGSISDCIQAAQNGVYPRRITKESMFGPNWLCGRKEYAIATNQRRTFTSRVIQSSKAMFRHWR